MDVTLQGVDMKYKIKKHFTDPHLRNFTSYSSKNLTETRNYSRN